MISETSLRQRPKLLALGFLPPPLGGVSVSFKIFCDIVARSDQVELAVINLSGRRRDRFVARGAVELIRQIWTQIRRCDVVMLYCATTQVPTLGLLTVAMCRLCGKPFILRKAASLDYRALGPVTGRVAEFVVKHTDLFLAQTRHLTDLCLRRGLVRTKWFPTSRPLEPLLDGRAECRRFVYIGQVRPSKGAFELVSAAERLPSIATLHVYGPFFDNIDEGLFARCDRIEYKGALDPGDVVATLREYDAFVLPSKALSEGYPGAILEAFSVGLPVIATTIGGIPEIVDEQCGILVEPGDVDGLVRAMLHLMNDPSAYQRLCRGARNARERFSAEYWTNWLVQECIELSRDAVETS